MDSTAAADSAPDRSDLGLPPELRACLFDLDGVLTDTASVHQTAWKQTFDPLLEERGLEPFSGEDYLQHVDGRPRYDGVRDFLRSRGIDLPEGDSDDSPETETVAGVGNRKNQLVLEELENGVEVFAGSVAYVHAVREAGLAVVVVTSSANGEQVLRVAGLSDLIDARIDGVVARERGLPGKPAPDTFLAGAAEVGVEPAHAAVFEDALSGVAAGRAGGFGFVVGVDRAEQADGLREAGADVVVTDLAQLREAR